MRNQTIEEFLKALKRFIARSDIIRQCKDICGCRWKFNLSRAPWWGGQFEHIIGLVKQTLVKVVGKLTLNWDKFEEVMLDIEATLNSRPLDYVVTRQLHYQTKTRLILRIMIPERKQNM